MNFLTFVIAAVAAMIAYGQYRTARQKLVLDLFEKRVAAYSTITDTMREIASVERMGTVTREDIELVDQALYSMDYLFGREIISCVHRLKASMRTTMVAEKDWNESLNQLGGNADTAEKRLDDAYDKLTQCRIELSKLIRPYILMDQKLPLPIMEWLRPSKRSA